ncbi:MAG: aminomethyl transferase family protein [Clostridiales bacterium]|jgi:glycine cleavage system aminomethyltransferase T|nr:aminomethyl transferase family protein [Eubacteriales bacterium]MDH7566635.1 aminomethyl transferase family protein [Clostridiales bacterium]
MNFPSDSAIFKGAMTFIDCIGVFLPYEYSGPKSEYLACRESAWLGINLNNTPVYDVSGPDAAKLFNRICVNRDFSVMKPGSSKHAIICNEKGQMLADGVVMKREGDNFRTYWMAPVLQYYVETSGLDVKGEYCQDEYFFQIDGPKSLEILEKACQCDLHDIKFAHNKKVTICGTEMVVHRLGMSGALAYEVHGAAKDAEVAYKRIREVLEEFGGKPQGVRNYGILNHTPAGYPNQLQHYAYPLLTSDPGLAEFAKKACFMMPLSGSAADDPEAFYVSPYDVGWGYLVNFDHDFMGKEALMKIKQNPQKKVVTLEWNTEDVGDVFMSQFRGRDVEPYDSIEQHSVLSDATNVSIRGDFVLADGKKIGIASGRTFAYYERRMISLAFIDIEYAEEGKELTVLWGPSSRPQKEIRATVARFPYYNGEFRNETFNVEKIPHPVFQHK